MNRSSGIIVARTDKLGDLILSLPTLVHLKKNLPGENVSLICRPDYLDVLSGFLKLHSISASSEWKHEFSNGLGFLGLSFDFSLGFRSLISKIPHRVGLLSKGWSFLVLNEGIRQHRARSEKHELEYNLELSDLLLKRMGVKSSAPLTSGFEFPLDQPSQTRALQVLDSLGVTGKFVVVHPGMAGSALNASIQQYAEMIEVLKQGGRRVVLSEGPAKEDRERCDALYNADPSLGRLSGQPLTILREIYRLSSLVVAPSTGPIHLAHWVGTPTVGIYSPVSSHHPRRWAPKGGTGKVEILVPEVDCPGVRDCIGKSCKDYFCMDQVSWGSLIAKAETRLRG